MSVKKTSKQTKNVTEKGCNDSSLKTVSNVKFSQQKLDVSPIMALPPNTGGKETCKNKEAANKVHNAVEQKRKTKINTYIANLAKILPNKDGKRWSKTEALQKAVEYIHEVKEAHEKLLLGKVDEVQEVEFRRLKRRIEELEHQNANYEKLLGFAGIATNADPISIWRQRKDFIGKLDPELIGMSDDGDVILLADEKRLQKDIKATTEDVETKKKTAKKNKTCVRPTAMTTTQNGTMEVGTTSLVTQSGWITFPITTTNESSVTQSTNCATAVTQTLPGVPIMSTSSHSATTTLQQPTIVNQLPLLNFGTTMNVMQTPMITINEQGIPVFQMVAAQQQPSNGQMIVNGNLISTGDATTIDCQTAAQTQSFIQNDAGIFQQTIVGHPTTRYVSHGTQQTNQMRLITPHMITTQNGNVVLGSQQSSTVLTVNSSASNNNTLPSALMLPNGQIIPVVREPSLIYPNTNPLGENLLMAATASTNVPQTIIAASNRLQQTQTSVSSNPILQNIGLDNGVRLTTANQVPEGRGTPQTGLTNVLASSNQQTNPTPQKSLPVSSSTSDLSSATKPQEAGVSSTIPSRSSTPANNTQATKKTSSRKTRAIKPKPQSAASSTVQSTKKTSNKPSTTTKEKSNKKKKPSPSSSPSVVVHTLATTPTVNAVHTTTAAITTTTNTTEVTQNSDNSSKPQPASRPSSLINDILAQATESIFATSASDVVSPTSSNFYSANSNGIDYMQTAAETTTAVSSSRSLERNASSPTASVSSKEHISSERIPDSRNITLGDENHKKTVDILSDLVGEVYQTASCESSIVNTLSKTTDSSSSSIGMVTSTCGGGGVEDVSTSSTDVLTSTEINNMKSPNVELASPSKGNNLSSESANTSVNEMELSPSSSAPTAASDVLSSSYSDVTRNNSNKRECTYEVPIAKRQREGEEPVVDTSLLDNKEDNSKVKDTSVMQQQNHAAAVADASSPANVSNASVVVNFVSVSQLASSSSSVVTSTVPPASSSSCSVTFANTIATSIAPFSIETAVSNDSSPLCSISPLLSSPNNKSNDLTFSLGAAISDLSRSDEASSGMGMEACAGGGGATFSPSFTPNSLTGSPNFGLSELGGSGGGLNGHQHPNFRTTYSSINSPTTRHSFSDVPDSQVIIPHTNLDKGHVKTHSMTYGQQQQQHQVGQHHHQHRGPMTNNSHNFHHTMQSSNTQVPPLFCQGYSTPLTHQHHSVVQLDTQSRPSVPNNGNGSNSNVIQSQSDVGRNKSKPTSNNHSRASVDNSDSVQQQHNNGMVTSSPSPSTTIQLQRSHSIHQVPDTSQMSSVNNHHRHTPNYNTSSRLHTLNHQSAPQGNNPSNNNNNNNHAHSPKIGDVHLHSPMGGGGGGGGSAPHSVASSSSTSPKPGMPPSRNHSVASPGRGTLPTPPVSSPATFAPHATVDAHLIGGYIGVTGAATAADVMVSSQDTFRDLNFSAVQKHTSQQQLTSMNSTAPRTTISYSAESLFQTQPRHRPNCAREGHAVSPMGRQLLVGTEPLQGQTSGPQPNFLQNVSRMSVSESIQNSSFPYFTLQQPTSNDQSRPQLGRTQPPTSISSAPLKHNSPTQTSTINKSCPPPARPTSDAGSLITVQSQPNFTFSLMQHPPPSEQQLTPQQHQRVGGGGSHSGGPHEVNSMRHNNYLPMGSYAAQMSAQMPGLQCPSQKDVQTTFHHHSMPPFGSNQPPVPGSHSTNIRGQVLTNSFGPHTCGGMENGPSFGDMAAPYQGQLGAATTGSENAPNVQVHAKSTHYKSKKSQEGSTTKASKSKQQTSRKKQQQQQQQQQQQLQYGMEEVNLSNSIFETGRSMTPYFSISNLSPPRNEAPTYIPNTNPLFNAPQRGVAPNVAVQQSSKASDVTTGPPYNPLFTPRSQGGTLNLNFQTPPGFGVNHLHHGNGGAIPNQITPHGPSGVVPPPPAPPPPPSHVPNFNLSNIFPDINSSNDGLSMSPIKFHHTGNHILPPTHHQPPSGMEHNLQHHHHHQPAGPLYHNRTHPPPPPPPPIHNGMTINSLLGHNHPHGFDGRSQVAIGINNTMTPPFHGHTHPTSFGNVIPALNFSMHDH